MDARRDSNSGGLSSGRPLDVGSSPTRCGENLVSAPICARMKVSDGGSNVSLKIRTFGISSTLHRLLKVVGTEGRDHPAIDFF